MMRSPRRGPTLVLTLLAGSLASCARSAGSDDAGAGDAAVDVAVTPPPPFTVVDLDPSAPAPLQLAVEACVGLSNRAAGGTVYVHHDAADQAWLDELSLVPAATQSADAFLKACTARFPACVRYDYKAQQTLLPSILTAGVALDAVPLDVGSAVSCAHPAFDATVELATANTPALAAKLVSDRFGDKTTGLAMLSPGWEDKPADPSKPALTNDMRGTLVDFVYSQRLFLVYLVNGCVAKTDEHAVLDGIVNSGRWPTPIGVYGYNSTWNVLGGDLYEAETLCLESHNMGQIASVVGNLSFFSTRRAPITEATGLAASPPDAPVYDPEKTYVAFVVGDGDNVEFMLHGRREWFLRRIAACQASGGACAPLTWTISPHLARLAPDVLDWYYQKAKSTGFDWFMLPPSGHLYAYPSSLNEPDQDRFVASTEDDARLLGVTGTVHWDWNGTWMDAETHFLPKYAHAGGSIRGVFPVNVPYLLPAFTWWPANQFVEVLTGSDGGNVAVFKPREWRGVDDSNDMFFPPPEKMAKQIAAYPKGTVTWVYMTSDGGLTLENAFLPLVSLLPANVELVSADAAARLAVAAAAAGH